MLADLTMIATLPVNVVTVRQAAEEGEVQAQQPEIPHPNPGPPPEPEQPVVPPDDPNRKDIDREPSIDPPPLQPPVQAVGTTGHHRTAAPARVGASPMTARVMATVATAAISLIAAACDRAETTNAAVKSTSPAGTSAAPSSDSAKYRDEALMRVVHAAPSTSNVDLFAGDLLLFDGLGFKSVTPYRAVDGQRYAFMLRPAGMTRAKPLSSNTEDLKDGDYYTAFAMPGDGQVPNLRVVNDRFTQPASGKARLRVVHAGVDAGKLALRASGDTDMLFDEVDYQTVSDYRDLAPLNGAIQVVGVHAAQTILTTINTRLEAGRYYTVVIVGNARTTPPLEAFLIEDTLTP